LDCNLFGLQHELLIEFREAVPVAAVRKDITERRLHPIYKKEENENDRMCTHN